MRRSTYFFTLATIAGLFSGCGSEESARVISNGQTFEVSVSQTQCDVLPPVGLQCNLVLRSSGYFGDVISITVTDIRPVASSLGSVHLIPNGIIDAFVTTQGVPQAIFGGEVRFTSISNISGNRVSAEYHLLTGTGEIEGDFSAKVGVGF